MYALIPVCTLLWMSSPLKGLAQNQSMDYFYQDGIMFFRGSPMTGTDPASFIELGHGYAKDRFNVYYKGKVLEYVDPFSFQLKRNTYSEYDDVLPYPNMENVEGYRITPNAVLFNGKKIKEANSHSFKILNGGYAKDNFHVYFLGKQIDNATTNSFQYIGDGYAKDSFRVFYLGKEMKDATPFSFKVTGNGYAEDTFRTYYRGREVSD